jgi:hypothetical protein
MVTMAQAKPRATKPKTARSETMARTEQRIRERAYELYLLRGCDPGLELEDWCRAEQEIVHAQMARLDEQTTG